MLHHLGQLWSLCMASRADEDLVRPASRLIALVSLLVPLCHSLVAFHRDEHGLAADGFL